MLKIKQVNNIRDSITINNRKVFDKWGSFSNPKFKAINNITQKAINKIDKNAPIIDDVSFFFVE